MLNAFGDFGFSLALAAIGSGLGAGIAGMAAIGAWKKSYMQNKLAPFIIIAFVGAPLSQTIYGMIVRNAIRTANWPPDTAFLQMIIGICAGAGIGVSAWMQGKCAASASDALAESGKGFGNYIMVLGIAETVALFVMVFTLTALPK
ncbi:MAG: V-type ATP synthase subunit K [Candidatus Margulisbacteria bacterium]|nr:V-type ATP synthase subunit K [Candidatus Margulisiibacteriota bacterium]